MIQSGDGIYTIHAIVQSFIPMSTTKVMANEGNSSECYPGSLSSSYDYACIISRKYIIYISTFGPP